MQKVIKKLWEAFTTVLVIIVLVLAILLGLPRIMNVQPLVVLSGSMEPVFMTGSLVYVQEIDTSELEVGDVITFYQDEKTIVTHRIIEKVAMGGVQGGVAYRTKGDANEMEDANLVTPDNVIGKAMFAIPYLGYLAQYIQQPPGLYIAIVVGAGLVLLMFLPDLFAKEEKKKTSQTEEKEKEEPEVKEEVHSRKKQEIKEKATSVESAKKKKRPLTEEEKREIIRRRKMREARERMAREQMSEEKKRPLTPEEKRELARRRKMYEERKRELARQKNQIEDID